MDAAQIEVALYDESANASISTKTSGSPIVAGVWNLVLVTYDGLLANSGLNVYVNGALEASTDAGSGTYLGMEDLATVLSLWYRLGAAAKESFFPGKTAGGPLAPWFAKAEVDAAGAEQIYEMQRGLLGV